MSDELKRLRADLEVIERYEGRMYALAAAKAEIGNKIAKIEAEADPWREAKETLARWRNFSVEALYVDQIVPYFDHLTAEVARLEKRVAELEAEDAADVADAEAALAKGEFVPFAERNAKPSRPHDRITMQRRIKMQRRELRRLNKKMGEYKNERYSIRKLKRFAEPLKPRDTSHEFDDLKDDEPVLDPARMLATACLWLDENKPTYAVSTMRSNFATCFREAAA